MRATQPLIKIMDFGLARLADAQTQLTQTGTMLGTGIYISPEQIAGERSDHRCDVWALGVVMYQMVSGCAPFEGKYLSAIAYSIMNERHESLSALAVDVPEDLARIVDKALEKSPDDRYQHLDEMLADLVLSCVS